MLLSNNVRQRQTGVTLVELIIAIVIISIASVALLTGLGFQTARNVDPMIQSQAQVLAAQYLNEVLSKPFFDPSADPRLSPSVSRDAADDSAANTAARVANATNRLLFDNIFEYNGYDQPTQELDGTAVPELAGYQIRISVDDSVGLTLGTLTNPGALCPPDILQVNVTVTDPRGQQTQLSGYRTSYFARPASWSCL